MNGGGVSKALRSRTSLARNQTKEPPVKAWESVFESFLAVKRRGT